MENIDLNSGLYIKNRNKYLANTKSNSLSIFHSNDQMPTNADGLMPLGKIITFLFMRH